MWGPTLVILIHLVGIGCGHKDFLKRCSVGNSNVPSRLKTSDRSDFGDRPDVVWHGHEMTKRCRVPHEPWIPVEGQTNERFGEPKVNIIMEDSTKNCRSIEVNRVVRKLQAIPLSLAMNVFGRNARYVGHRHILKDLVGIGNDGQSLKSFEQRNDVITSV